MMTSTLNMNMMMSTFPPCPALHIVAVPCANNDVVTFVLHRLISVDEAQVNLDMTDAKKSQQEKGIFLPKSADNGDVMSNKSSNHITVVGGSKADGNSLPACFIFDRHVNPKFLTDLPKSSLQDPKTRKYLESTIFTNTSGGMEKGLFGKYIKSNLVPALSCNLPCDDDDTDEDEDPAEAAREKLLYAQFCAELNERACQDDLDDHEYFPELQGRCCVSPVPCAAHTSGPLR